MRVRTTAHHAGECVSAIRTFDGSAQGKSPCEGDISGDWKVVEWKVGLECKWEEWKVK